MAAMIDRLKDRLFGIHVHDNMADADRHLPINDGNLDWPRIFKALRRIPGNCALVLEYCPGTPVSKLREGCEIITKEVLGGV
jgi:sugar phosphate isomerase/epimerase